MIQNLWAGVHGAATGAISQAGLGVGKGWNQERGTNPCKGTHATKEETVLGAAVVLLNSNLKAPLRYGPSLLIEDHGFSELS